MATTVARLQAVLSADASAFNRTMDSSEKKLGVVTKAAGVAGLALGAGLAVAAKAGFDELMNGQKVAAQTNAVLKSTGGTANVTADQVNKLAGSLLRKTGIDDEQIQTGENMLLTFTRIRNELGKGNDIFTQATKVTTDLSVAMGKDMQSSAVLVGKALNDPIQGLTALTRVGVSFTEQQKDQIKALVDSGNTMGAQKVILAELTTEFGGSADAAGKTLAGQLNIAKETFQNLAAQIVTAVLPAVTAFAGILTTVTDYLTAHTTTAKIVVGVLGTLAAVLVTVSVATKVWTAAQLLLNTALALNPIGIVILALTALGVGLVVAYQKSETFRDIVKGAFNLVKDAGDEVKNLAIWFRDIGSAIFATVQTAWDSALSLIKGALGGAKTAIGDVKDLAVWFRDVGAGIIGGLKAAWNGPLDDIADAWVRFGNPIGLAITSIKWLRDHGGDAIALMWKVVQKPLGLVSDAFKDMRDAIQKIVDLIQWLGDKAGGIIGGVADTLGKIHLPHIPGIGDVAAGFNADAADAARSGYAAYGLQPQTSALLSTIESMFGGVTVTSGYRTAEQNALVGGAPGSDHLTGRAFDLVPSGGWTAAGTALLDRIAAYAAGLPQVRWIGWRGVPGHGPGDHLHISTYDKGGFLRPGWNLAYNGLGRPEPVGFGGNVTVNVGGTVVTERELDNVIVDAIRRARNMGRPV